MQSTHRGGDGASSTFSSRDKDASPHPFLVCFGSPKQDFYTFIYNGYIFILNRDKLRASESSRANKQQRSVPRCSQASADQ